LEVGFPTSEGSKFLRNSGAGPNYRTTIEWKPDDRAFPGYRNDHFLGRKFGPMKTKTTRHDANTKKIMTATRTDRTCP
jgi:hypothetical protein